MTDTARKCPECATPLPEGARGDMAFCSPQHKQAFHNRSMKRGRVLTPLVMAQAGLRAPGKASSLDLKEVASRARSDIYILADAWNREDKKAGRPPMFLYVADRLAYGWNANDLV